MSSMEQQHADGLSPPMTPYPTVTDKYSPSQEWLMTAVPAVSGPAPEGSAC